MKEITLETKIAELLNEYDGMKDILIDINPKFKKLNNPILRRTIAKVAGVKQAAIVGGMNPTELLNKLRIAVGQEPIGDEVETKIESGEKPSWIEEPKFTFDANKLLDEEKNPLAEVNIALKKLSSDEIVAITSDFKPEPLIDEFKKKGYEVYCEEESSEKFVTYIRG
jgi:hypothetical protein